MKSYDTSSINFDLCNTIVKNVIQEGKKIKCICTDTKNVIDYIFAYDHDIDSPYPYIGEKGVYTHVYPISSEMLIKDQFVYVRNDITDYWIIRFFDEEVENGFKCWERGYKLEDNILKHVDDFPKCVAKESKVYTIWKFCISYKDVE